jgi:FAD/FMN-containing dehydrogenase/predicted methyltransferase
LVIRPIWARFGSLDHFFDGEKMKSLVTFLSLLLTGSLAYGSGLKGPCEVLVGGVEDYSQSQKYEVYGTVTPKSLVELANIVKTTNRPIAVRGAGFSMGGQTASNHGLVVDMRNMNKVLDYNVKAKTIRVQTGATWRQIQELILKDNLAIMIMQSYNNFQVGGSLSVNAHGRYVGYGPLVSSVEEIRVMLADGSIVTASRTERPEIFAAAIGGYAAIGIIVEAKLKLAENKNLERTVKSYQVGDNLSLAVEAMVKDFREQVEKDPTAVMFNADLYPPDYNRIDAITFRETDKELTDPKPIQTPEPEGLIANIARATMVTLEQKFPAIKRYRANVMAPKELAQPRVVTRMNEASYDNSALKPLADRLPITKSIPGINQIANRKALLQEYFIPVGKVAEFTPKMVKIFKDAGVNVSNVSFRHVPKNMESTLSWAKEDSFALVIYYTQTYGSESQRLQNLSDAKDWTRDMMAEIEKVGGTFYLPYQIYASRDQFNHMYPNHQQFFELKKKLDPTNKFNNSLWDQYRLSEDTYHYRELLASPTGRDELRDYFTNIFSINDASNAIKAIEEAMQVTLSKGRDPNDRSVYDELLKIMPKYQNGFFKRTAETLKALTVQQKEMAKQTAEALKEQGVNEVNGYVEIGSPGRYVWALKQLMKIKGKIYAVNDTFEKKHWIETKFGFRIPAVALVKKILFSNYDQFQQLEIMNESVDLVSMFIGLHHCPPEKLDGFIASINRVLRVGGRFVLRDHDANEKLLAMAFMAHSTYNAGLGLSYDEELNEVRNLQKLDYWKRKMEQAGFKHVGQDKLQAGDPTGNTLMVFEKIARTAETESAIRQQIAQAGAGLNLNLLPGYKRDQSNTYMTQGEWFLVDIFKELGSYTKHSPWFTFPFTKFVDLYAKVYGTTREFAQREGIQDSKQFKAYDSMDSQLLSGIKMMFKSLDFFANRVKKSAAGIPDSELVIEQKVLSDFFVQYAQFMTHTPWYRFPHKRTFNDLVERFKEDRGYVSGATEKMISQMRLLFGAMDFTAAIVRRGLKEETVDLNTRFLLEVNSDSPEILTANEKVELQRLTETLVLGRTERYMPFTEAMKALADSHARVLNVAGNTHISVLIKTPQAKLPQVGVPVDQIMDYQFPTAGNAGGETAFHHMIRVKVSDLPLLLKQLDQMGLEVVRVHDY